MMCVSCVCTFVPVRMGLSVASCVCVCSLKKKKKKKFFRRYFHSSILSTPGTLLPLPHSLFLSLNFFNNDFVVVLLQDLKLKLPSSRPNAPPLSCALRDTNWPLSQVSSPQAQHWTMLLNGFEVQQTVVVMVLGMVVE